MTRPACEGCDTEYWFSTDPAERDIALRICQACPIKAKCLADTLHREGLGPIGRGYIHGVADGLTAAQRLKVIVPLCVRCHGERTVGHWYCEACSEVARVESKARADARKRMNRERAA